MRHAVHPTSATSSRTAWRVGVTHWEELGAGQGDLPGPDPGLLLRPRPGREALRDWGRAGLERGVAEAWHPFCEWTAGWLEVIRGQGFEGVKSAYLEVLEGHVAPKSAHVISLNS